MKVFAPGLSVAVIDGSPTPVSASGSGSVKVYAPGLSVEVREPATQPPDPSLGAIITIPLNPSALIVPLAINESGSTYERYTNPAIAEGDTWEYKWRCYSSNLPRPFRTTPYRLMIDGVERGSVTYPSTQTLGSITVDCTTLAHGWHELMLLGDASETSPVVFLFVKRGGTDPATMPVGMGSHDYFKRSLQSFSYAPKVPAKYAPTPMPLAPYTATAFPDPLARSALYMHEVVPWQRSNSVDIYDTRISNGVVNACNGQDYLFTPLIRRYPDKALYDGPRGVAKLNGITHIEMGRNNQMWVAEAWRIVQVKGDGTVKTLAGIRSRVPAARPASRTVAPSAADFDLIGDWSSMPVERRGFHETWGLAWYRKTLAVDPNATPIMNNGVLEQPHIVGPVMFVADSQMNRIVKIQFDPADHDPPAVVTEFITGLADPWDVRCIGDTLYVTERFANKISMWSAVDGSPLGTLLQGPTGNSLAYVREMDRMPMRLAPLSSIRAAVCVLPEGLYNLDDKELYFGSIAMAGIYKIDLATKAVTKVIELDPAVYFSGGVYCKFSISDGTTGPLGSVFIGSWNSGSNNGLPWGFKPDATGNLVGWAWASSQGDFSGPGLPQTGLGYSGVPACKAGRIAFSASVGGLAVAVKATGQAKVTNERYSAAAKKWFELGLHLAYGHDGNSPYGLPPPWGKDALTDDWLVMHGHIKGA